MVKNINVNCDDLDCYILCDPPTTCGLCGTRTDFEEITEILQLHVCLNPTCRYKFIVEKDE